MSDGCGGCFRKSCLGCLALGVILAIVVAVVAAIAAAQLTREPEPRSIDDAQPIPRAAAVEQAEPPTQPIDVAEPGRVIVDVGMIEFRVQPAPAGTPLRLDGAYDAGAYAVDQSYEPEGELGWRYTLTVRRRGWLPRFAFNDDGPTRLTLHIPRDAPIALTGSVGAGMSQLELGGLWLVDVDLEIGAGEHGISFREPLAAPLARFSVDASYGEFSIERLGNASPLEARIAHSAGEVRIDLDGAWRADGSVAVRCGFGECAVRLPRQARVELDVPRLAFGESSVRKPPEPRGDASSVPVVHVAVSASAGEVRVD